METLTENDEEDDDEPSEEQQKAAALVGKKEKDLADRALKSFTTGLGLLKTKLPESSFAEESIRAAQELEEYGVSLDPVPNRGKFDYVKQEAIVKDLTEVKGDKGNMTNCCLFVF